VFFRQNPGWHILHDVVDDALKARVGIVQVYWGEDVSHEDENFESLSEVEVTALAAQDDVDELTADMQEDGSYKGLLTRKTDNSQVCIENIPPEHFGIDPWAKKLKGSFHYKRELMTKDEIEAMGWDASLLKNLNPATEEYVTQELETQARFNQIDSGYQPQDKEDQEEMRRYAVYECVDTFIRDKGDRPRLWKTVICNTTVLDCQEIKRSPFKVFSALRVAHSFWGNSFGGRMVPTQNARTVLTRGILDHTVITNNPRYTVLQSGLTNPREMLDNRLGGIVNITRPDAVTPLQQPSLNPFVFQTLGSLKENAEEMTGISSLAQGLNKDAISSQNSQGMVQDLVTLSKQRQKVVARNLAEFLAEVFIEISNLCYENMDKDTVMEIAGNWTPVNIKTWKERRDYTIQFYLTQASADAEASKLTNMMGMAKQDPFLQRSMGDQGTYNFAQDIAKLGGLKGFSRYFQPPQNTPPAQPTPDQLEAQLKQQELQFKQQELPVRLQGVQAKTQGEVAGSMAEIAKAKAETANAHANAGFDHIKDLHAMKMAEHDSRRKDLDVANRVDISQRELQKIEKAPPKPTKLPAPKG
jgi:hypothetical protein